MMIQHPDTGAISNVRVDHRRLRARDMATLIDLVGAARAAGQRGMLIDVARLTHVTAETLVRLVDVAAHGMPDLRVGLVGAGPRLFEVLRDAGLEPVLPVFTTRARALAHPIFRALQLAGCDAVVLCAGQGSRVAPLTTMQPKPMLDLLGRPVLEHILRHLAGFGVSRVVLNPGHLGPQIPAHFSAGLNGTPDIFYVNEGCVTPQGWHASPVGSASTLATLAHSHNLLDRDTIVMCGDAVVDIDLADMMATHRASGAAVTIAAQTVAPDAVEKYGIMVTDPEGRITQFQEKPARAEAQSRLANAGIYILSPAIRPLLEDRAGLDIAGDLLPRVAAAGLTMAAYSATFAWTDIGCGRDYARAVFAGLSDGVPGLEPGVELRGDGLWAHPSARVARGADISGPVYIAAGASVAAGARVVGPCAILAGSEVAAGAFVSRSILMPGTQAGSDAWVDGMIAAPDWAVAHAHADGSAQPTAPIDGVGPVRAAPSERPGIRVAPMGRATGEVAA
ncbi:MAG: sugar phosphate nucleotidyltransferase [Pseudomonadota bacterium]